MMEALMLSLGAAILMFSAYALAIILVLWVGDKLDQWGEYVWIRCRGQRDHGRRADVGTRPDSRDE